jgi:hypothetical protein
MVPGTKIPLRTTTSGCNGHRKAAMPNTGQRNTTGQCRSRCGFESRLPHPASACHTRGGDRRNSVTVGVTVFRRSGPARSGPARSGPARSGPAAHQPPARGRCCGTHKAHGWVEPARTPGQLGISPGKSAAPSIITITRGCQPFMKISQSQKPPRSWRRRSSPVARGAHRSRHRRAQRRVLSQPNSRAFDRRNTSGIPSPAGRSAPRTGRSALAPSGRDQVLAWDDRLSLVWSPFYPAAPTTSGIRSPATTVRRSRPAPRPRRETRICTCRRGSAP